MAPSGAIFFIIIGLQSHPELFGGAQRTRETNSGIRTDCTIAVHNLDFVCVTVSPNKTDAPLIIDANTVLTFAFTFQCFESIWC